MFLVKPEPFWGGAPAAERETLRRPSLRSFVRYAGRCLRCQCLFQQRKAMSIPRLDRILRSIFGKDAIWIAVEPTLAWLCGSNRGMSAGVRVFAGVLIRRTVAAQRYSTCLARAQMNPAGTNLYALCAFPAFRLFDRFDCIQMRTASSAHNLFIRVILWLPTSCGAKRDSCEFQRRPFRLRRPPQHNA